MLDGLSGELLTSSRDKEESKTIKEKSLESPSVECLHWHKVEKTYCWTFWNG